MKKIAINSVTLALAGALMFLSTACGDPDEIRPDGLEIPLDGNGGDGGEEANNLVKIKTDGNGGSGDE